MLIVRDDMLGVPRFDQFEERLGISRNILRQRLDNLTDHGVLEKVPYSDHPPRYEYRLTAKGQDLSPVVTTMRQWGDKYAAPDGPPIQLVHERCGTAFHAEMTCSNCGERVPPSVGRARVDTCSSWRCGCWIPRRFASNQHRATRNRSGDAGLPDWLSAISAIRRAARRRRHTRLSSSPPIPIDRSVWWYWARGFASEAAGEAFPDGVNRIDLEEIV